jgi:UDP-glucose 4-epimerase
VQQKALVTGATGSIGPSLVKRLLEAGYSVRALSRNPPERGCLPDGVEFFAGDISATMSLEEAVKDVDIVFHLAAKGHVVNPSPTLDTEYRAINVGGTRRLVAAAKKAGVHRMVYFSTINVYGPGDLEKVCDENSPINPVSIYGKTKAEAERIVLSEMRAVVLRLAAVYGPRMRGNYRALLAALKKGSFVMVGNGLNRRTLVHMEDVCQAAMLAAGDSAALGRVYNVTDGEIHTFQEIVRVMCSALGRDYPKFQISGYPVRRILGYVEDTLRLCGQKAPVGRFTVDKLLEDMAVKGDRIQNELGYQPKFELETGWKNCVQRMRI